MKFRPLHDRVVIRRAEGDLKSTGGIIIPDTAKEKPQEGEVIAVGPGFRDESGKLVPLDVKAGDLILFGKWSGTEVKIDDEDLLIMKESDIMGVVEKTGAAAKNVRLAPPARDFFPALQSAPTYPVSRSCLGQDGAFARTDPHKAVGV
jgi:chaperonin GroES